MAFRTISVVLSANARSLNAALYQAARSIDFFAGGVEGKGVRSLLKFGAAATATTLGAFGIERALKSALTQTVAFDAAMRNVNSISHLSEQQFRGLSDSVLHLSTRLPQSATTLAQGLYDIASSGFQGADGLKVLQASAEAASAGLSTTATSAQAITAVLNAYGLSASQAGAVSDTLFQTVNVGVVTFDQLAGVLGDVVGLASQAGVDINQVGSAIATMTLSGVSAAESTTSLNRVLRALISPSQSLGILIHQMGFESGVAALHARGLHGVMEDIRKATGGNITTLQALFPDIRALRGALALTADEGRNYNRVAGQIENANARQGATHRALAEQMKSLQFQWDVFRNRVSAAAIEMTRNVLPSIISLLQGLERLGNEAFPAILSGAHDLAPFFHSLASIGADLGHVLATVLAAVSPLGAALAAIGAAGVITTLNGIAEALAGIVDFLTTNRVGMVALATVLGVLLIPRMIALGVAMRTAAGNAIGAILLSIGRAAQGAADGIYTLRTAFSELAASEAVATLGITAILAGIVEEVNAVSTANRNAKESAEQLGQGYRVLQPGAVSSRAAIAALNEEIARGQSTIDRYKRSITLTSLRGALQNLTPFTKNTVQNNVSDFNAAIAERKKLLDETYAAQKRTNIVASQLNIPITAPHDIFQNSQQLTALRNLATHLHLDEALAGPPEKAAPAMAKLKQAWQDFSAQTGVSTAQFVHNVGTVDIGALQKLAKAIADVQKNVRQSFGQANDVIANFHPDKAATDLHSALQSLSQARGSLADLESKTGKAAASAHELAAAHQKVADAQQAVNKAQTEGDLAGFYTKQIHDSRQFLANIEDATRRGLDPGFISRLLQAGPEQAGPLLDQIVAGHGARMVRLVNSSEHALAAISRRAVELARLTTLAISAQSDQMGKDLARAQRIDLETLSQGRGATVASVARALGMDPTTVQRIAGEFGISLITAARRVVAAQPPLTLRFTYQRVGPSLTAISPTGSRTPVNATFSEGGPVTGPGGPTTDSIVARLSTGEYVQSARSVAYYGRDLMDKLNARAIPRYAEGGYVTPMPRNFGPPAVTVKMSGGGTSVTNNRTVTVGQVVAHSYDDFLQQLDRDARYSAVIGGDR